MIRSIALGLLIAVASTGLGTFPFPARAQDPAEEQARPARRAQQRAAQERRHWWNDPAVVEKLGLSDAQRATIEREFEVFQSAQGNRGGAREAQDAFYEALVKGDSDRARSKLDEMVRKMREPAEALGALKIRVFSELSQEQRDLLASEYPGVVRQAWTPRASWKSGMGQRRPARPRQERPQR
jgi:hypothetical protein